MKTKGRPSAYETRIKPFLNSIAILRREGKTHDEIAKMLNIAQSTYFKHKAEIETFTESLNKSDDGLVEKMEATLYDLANGRVKVTKIEYKYVDGEEIPVKKTVDQLPPNPASLFFGLSNLRPNKWKHRQELENRVSEEDIVKVQSFTETFINQMKGRKNETSGK